MRTWGQKEDDDNSYVSSMCMEKQACKDLEKKCEDKELKDENDKPLKCAVACCSTDECNGSSEVYFGVIFLATCSIFGLALIKWSRRQGAFKATPMVVSYTYTSGASFLVVYHKILKASFKTVRLS